MFECLHLFSPWNFPWKFREKILAQKSRAFSSSFFSWVAALIAAFAFGFALALPLAFLSGRSRCKGCWWTKEYSTMEVENGYTWKVTTIGGNHVSIPWLWEEGYPSSPAWSGKNWGFFSKMSFYSLPYRFGTHFRKKKTGRKDSWWFNVGVLKPVPFPCWRKKSGGESQNPGIQTLTKNTQSIQVFTTYSNPDLCEKSFPCLQL